MTRRHRRAHLWAWFTVALTVAAVWFANRTGGVP
jgi:hypothetical protein